MLVKVTLGLLLLGVFAVSSKDAWVLIRWTSLAAGLRLSMGMLMILLWKCRIILIFGLMVAGSISLLWVGLRLLALVFSCLLLKSLLIVQSGEQQRSTVTLAVSDAVLSYQFLGSCRLFSVLDSGVLLLPCRRTYWPCHVGIDNLHVARTIGRLLDKDCSVKPLRPIEDGDLVALVQYMIRTRGRETVRAGRSKEGAQN